MMCTTHNSLVHVNVVNISCAVFRICRDAGVCHLPKSGGMFTMACPDASNASNCNHRYVSENVAHSG